MQEMQETQVWSLGQEDPLQEEMATHSVFLPGESQEQRRLVGYGPWGPKRVWCGEVMLYIHSGSQL